MSTVAEYTNEEFQREFPLDFGHGVRGQRIITSSGYKGLVVAHLVKFHGKQYSCAVVISFQIGTGLILDHTLWGVLNEDPLTIDNLITCVNCPNHNMGYIRQGKWEIR